MLFKFLFLLLFLVPGMAFPTETAPKSIKRYALLVGIDQYADPKIEPLQQAVADVKRFQFLLGAQEYNFDQVLTLVDKEATRDAFKAALEKLEGLAQADDLILIFFAGYGTQIPDRSNKKEADNKNEMLVFYDTIYGTDNGLVDDDFWPILNQLYRKSSNLTLILDCGSSGSVVRDTIEGRRSRQLAMPASVKFSMEGALLKNTPDLDPQSLSKMIVVSAAPDGDPAEEDDQGGLLTQGLIRVLSDQQVSKTWGLVQKELYRQKLSQNLVLVQGDLEKIVFSNARRLRGNAWMVVPPDGSNNAEKLIQVEGPFMAGMGKGAEMRIYDANLSGGDLYDPAKAKAWIRILDAGTFKALGEPFSGDQKIVAGDLAVLALPGNHLNHLEIRLRPFEEPGGLPPSLAESIREAVTAHEEAKIMVRIVERGAELEYARREDGAVLLLDPAERTLYLFQEENEAATAAAILGNLLQQVRIKALLGLKGEGGTIFADERTLEVQIIPSDQGEVACQKRGFESQTKALVQTIPLCNFWVVKVRLNPNCKKPLRVGGLYLTASGSILNFPLDNQAVILEPGQSHEFSDDVFLSGPPLETLSHVLVFGTEKDQPISWHLLADTSRNADFSKANSLSKLLGRYLSPSLRGEGGEIEVNRSSWCLSSLPIKVVE